MFEHIIKYHILTNNEIILYPIHEYWQHVETIIKIKKNTEANLIYTVVSESVPKKLKLINLPDALIGIKNYNSINLLESIQYKTFINNQIISKDNLLQFKLNKHYDRYIINGNCTLLKIDILNDSTFMDNKNKLSSIRGDFNNKIEFTQINPKYLWEENSGVIKELNYNFNSFEKLKKEISNQDKLFKIFKQGIKYEK